MILASTRNFSPLNKEETFPQLDLTEIALKNAEMILPETKNRRVER